MYKIGLKLWSTNTDIYLEKSRHLFKRHVFAYIELYVVPGSTSLLSAWERLRQEAGIPFIIHNAHFMQGFNLAKPECAATNRHIYHESKLYADTLAAEHIIFHGGIDGSITETARQLAGFCEPRALIENKPFRAIPNRMGGGLCRGYDKDEIETVMNTTQCGFCLDFGHAICAANSLKQDPYEYINQLARLKPTMFHLTDVTDITSEFDSHVHLGKGQINFARILRCLPDNARVTLETEKSSKDNLEDFIEDSLWFRRSVLVVRPAKESDIDQVFKLSNDPQVRANSFNTGAISKEEHQVWFHRKLLDPKTTFMVIETCQGDFIGQVRFEKQANAALISISIHEKYRGQGIAHLILEKAISFFREKSSSPILAQIKPTNNQSYKLFTKCGFKHLSTEEQSVTLRYDN